MDYPLPDFGLAGLRYDMRDKLGGACELCGAESDTRVCAECAVRECPFCESRCTAAEPDECWR